MGTKYFHITGTVLIGAVPFALYSSPSLFNKPVDFALAFVIPLHSHIAMNYVITDYVPKALKTVARASILGTSVLMCLGFLKLNVFGPGITETVKSLWKEPASKEEKHH